MVELSITDKQTVLWSLTHHSCDPGKTCWRKVLYGPIRKRYWRSKRNHIYHTIHVSGALSHWLSDYGLLACISNRSIHTIIQILLYSLSRFDAPLNSVAWHVTVYRLRTFALPFNNKARNNTFAKASTSTLAFTIIDAVAYPRSRPMVYGPGRPNMQSLSLSRTHPTAYRPSICAHLLADSQPSCWDNSSGD